MRKQLKQRQSMMHVERDALRKEKAPGLGAADARLRDLVHEVDVDVAHAVRQPPNRVLRHTRPGVSASAPSRAAPKQAWV